MKFPRRHWQVWLLLIVPTLIAACTAAPVQGGGEEPDAAKLQVVSSFTVLTDIATQIGGERVEVHNLVPRGTDPHSFEALPEDLKALSEADLVLYNGLNLEGGEQGWLFRLLEASNQSVAVPISATAGVVPLYVNDQSGVEEPNPHAFASPKQGITMAQNVAAALEEADPQGANYYQARAANYIAQLEQLDSDYSQALTTIPEDQRVLVTSERAFQYLAADYGLQEAYIWSIDTEENGSPNQLKTLIEFIRTHQVPAVFVESNVDPRPMETISIETSVPIAGTLYSDELGKAGSGADTYIGYLRHNLETIVGGLRG